MHEKREREVHAAALCDDCDTAVAELLDARCEARGARCAGPDESRCVGTQQPDSGIAAQMRDIRLQARALSSRLREAAAHDEHAPTAGLRRVANCIEARGCGNHENREVRRDACGVARASERWISLETEDLGGVWIDRQ